MGYTTKGKIQNYMAIDIDSSMDTQIAEWISATQRYVDNYTGRSFEGSVAEARYFDGNGKTEIDIDDFITITKIEILEIDSTDVEYTLVEGASEDFITYPYNSTNKFRLILMPNKQIAVWPREPKRIKVTATWGISSSVPEDISLATTMLVAGIIEKGVSGGTVQSESLGDYSVTYKLVDDISNVMGVKDILDRYKIYTL